MRFLCTILLLLFITNTLIGQNSLEDVVYLKDGSIIKGTIIEQVPNEMIKIETRIGNIMAYKFSEIDKITKETSNSKSKEGNSSILLMDKSKPKHVVSKPNPVTQAAPTNIPTDSTTSVLVNSPSQNTAPNELRTSVNIQTSDLNTITDIEGNVYKVVKIGKQEWMAENLKTAHFSDNTPITLVEDNEQWNNSSSPSYCYYEDNPTYNMQYGKLYNWYVLSTTHNICPNGWHVPSNDDWEELLKQLGGNSTAGIPLKSVKYWTDNKNGENTSGFNALPAGLHRKSGPYQTKGECAFFWSAIQKSETNAWCYLLYYKDNYLYKDGTSKNDGMSIRCVKD